MSLPHLLLGLLHAEPRTGYELARAIRDEIEPAWSAGYSQIYPVLARLRRSGWVRLRTLGPRRGPPRLLYRATAAGRRELQRWLSETPPAPRHNDALLLRLALLDALPAAERRHALDSAEVVLAAEVARLEELPAAQGYRALSRRASVEQHTALRRFLRAGGATPQGSAPRRSPRTPGKKRREDPPRRSGA